MLRMTVVVQVGQQTGIGGAGNERRGDQERKNELVLERNKTCRTSGNTERKYSGSTHFVCHVDFDQRSARSIGECSEWVM